MHRKSEPTTQSPPTGIPRTLCWDITPCVVGGADSSNEGNDYVRLLFDRITLDLMFVVPGKRTADRNRCSMQKQACSANLESICMREHQITPCSLRNAVTLGPMATSHAGNAKSVALKRASRLTKVITHCLRYASQFINSIRVLKRA